MPFRARTTKRRPRAPHRARAPPPSPVVTANRLLACSAIVGQLRGGSSRRSSAISLTICRSCRRRLAANTRSKTGQQPLLLLDIAYKPGTEYHIGRLPDLLDVATGSQPVRGPDDYTIGFATLRGDQAAAADKIDRITVTVSPTFARRNPAALTEFASLLPDGRVTVTVA